MKIIRTIYPVLTTFLATSFCMLPYITEINPEALWLIYSLAGAGFIAALAVSYANQD